MTMQSSDYLYYQGKKYTLIATEKDTDLINSADFGLKNNICMTCCYRGYMAEYFIENNFLYGEKTVDGGVERTDSQITLFFQKSQKLRMNYTGSLLLARNRDEHFSLADFIPCYLDFDEAFEFYFIDGELTEITNLSNAIQEWHTIKNKLDTKSGQKSGKKHSDKTQEFYTELWRKQDEIAVKYLKYQYCNYKWQE
ncbi:MAG: hypothetical protein K2J71_07405 [Oscillospiraceae bacterium]|nr:hypothetical protein [Oscillospiraceae bacterium]